jgi:hypothetical protein
MQQADFVALVHAAQSLESMGLATRMSQLVGMPIEKHYPDIGLPIVTRITKIALKQAPDDALFSLKNATEAGV